MKKIASANNNTKKSGLLIIAEDDLEIMPTTKQFEQEMMFCIDCYKKNIIPQVTSTWYPGDSVLIETYVTEKFVIAVSNLQEDRKRKKNAYLRSLFVPKTYRGIGTGTGLLAIIASACKKYGIKAIETEPLNSKSRKFFVKNGFKKMQGKKFDRHILYIK